MGDFLFGKGPEVSTLPAQSRLAPEQMEMFKNLLGMFSGGPSSPLSTGFVGGYSPIEQKSIGMLEDYMTKAGGFNAPEYFEEMIKKPLMSTWEEEIMPTIGGEFGKKGLFYGSGRREAELKSGETLMDILAKGKVQTEQMGREIGLQEILGLSGTGMSMGSIPFQRLMALMGIETEYPQNTIVDPGQQGFLQQLLAGAGPLAMGAGSLGWTPFKG